ncbi:hypothetical protein ES703_26195 [subsurface metagenome]
MNNPFEAVLLKTQYQFLAQTSSRSIWIFAAVALGFVFLLILGSILAGRRGSAMNPDQRRKYSRYVFRKMARDIGLQKNHLNILEYLIRVCRVKQPFLIFSNAGLLDDMLKKGIYSLERNRDLEEEQRENRLSLLFQIKQLIERNSRRGIGVKSTNLMKPGQPLAMSPESGGQYQTRVVSNMRDLLACSSPRNQGGYDFRWPKGTRLAVHFWRDSDAGYTFRSKVLGYDTIKGEVCVLIQHSKTVRREQQRKFRRKPLNRPCFFYPISIQSSGAGRRSTLKAVVQYNQSMLGNILDISAGGCSITALSALKAASLMKMEFEIGGAKRISVYGKVKRTRTLKTRSIIMHVMFTKLSGRHLNQIYTYVYNYASVSPVPIGLS